ncbi:MAG: crotonase/enoyl-CoA hydratase family protein [Chloroflexi bacterium]|nr:crotonase/enoyl-CoA hydratase family protein [Chloroflexota bacterium]
MTDAGRVTIERRGHVLLMGLDRVAKRNAFDLPMYRELAQAYGELERDPALRCGVLFAHGDHFTAGLDLKELVPRLPEGYPEGTRPFALPEGAIDPLQLASPFRATPLVIAVQGLVFTIGVELLLAADVRVAASDARFAQLEVQRGLYPFGGATIRFVREAGWGNAMRYLLTGDEFGAQEAMRMGLVQEVAEPGRQLDRALELADRIAAQAPLGVRAVLASARLAVTEGEEAAIRRLRPDLEPILHSADLQEGIRSFVERRPARFSGE